MESSNPSASLMGVDAAESLELSSHESNLNVAQPQHASPSGVPAPLPGVIGGSTVSTAPTASSVIGAPLHGTMPNPLVQTKAAAEASSSANQFSSALGAQAAAAFLQQYFAQQPQSLPPAEAGTMQHTLWQLQQAMQQPQPASRIPPQEPSMQQQHHHPTANIPICPAPAPVAAAAAPVPVQPLQPQLPFPPSTVSLCSTSIPSAVTMSSSNSSNHSRKRKPDDNVLQFSDAASKSLKLDHARSVMSSSSVASLGDTGPPKEKTEEELERMGPAERRRYERNLREQQRSYRISQQIKTLRDVLSESGIPFKPNKFSILVSVSDYIKNLQQRSIMLDAEQKKLVETIRRTSEMVASGQVPSSEDDRTVMEASNEWDRDVVFVQGLDYRSIFDHSPFASGVASLDGRILYANQSLEHYFGMRCRELEQQSLFLHIRNHQDVFEAMADILRRSSISCETGGNPVGPLGSPSSELLFWSGVINTHKNLQLKLCISLTCAGDGAPKFFTFTVTSAI